MTHTPDETKKGLECCRNVFLGDHWKNCDSACPYQAEQSYCKNTLHHDALALIQQLQAENAEQAERIRELYACVGEAKKNLDCWQAKLDTKLDSVEAGVVRLFQYCKELQAERDAAVADMAEIVGCPCGVCKHYLKDGRKEPCNSCRNIRRGEESHFEWRGVQKE